MLEDVGLQNLGFEGCLTPGLMSRLGYNMSWKGDKTFENIEGSCCSLMRRYCMWHLFPHIIFLLVLFRILRWNALPCSPLPFNLNLFG